VFGREWNDDWSECECGDCRDSRESRVPDILHDIHEDGVVAYDDKCCTLHGLAFDRGDVIILY
jgi:hypothetical protein